MTRSRAFLLGLVLAAASSGCGRRETAPPNIILISIDTLRRDHLGCYGYRRETSPNLDALAREGTLFENVVSTCSWTLPSHTSMLTGLYPAFHGLQDDGTRLATRIPTLAEKLRAAGYYTMAVVSHVYVSSAFGLDRGFIRFDDDLIERGATNPTAKQVVDRTLGHFADYPKEPFFLFLHFFDPHWDYAPPPPFHDKFTDPGYSGPIDGTIASLTPYFRGDRAMSEADLREAIALYDGEIAYVDEQIDRLLATLGDRGYMDNTTIIVTGDHGEEFRDHGMLGHAKSLFTEQLGVPLLIAGNRSFPGGERRREVVSIVDLAPTILDLAGVEIPRDLQGISLAGGKGRPGRLVIGESIRFGNEMRAIRRGPYKLIHYFQGDAHRFYDLETDPREQRPLPSDPTGGDLLRAMEEYAAVADKGWHLKLMAARENKMRCRGTIHAEGRIVSPRRYFSGHLSGPSRAVFESFELSADASHLTFDATLSVLNGEIAFRTSPADASVAFDVRVEGAAEGAGVFLGRGERLPNGETIRIAANDPRARGLPEDYTNAPSGCYIRAVFLSVEPGESADLPDEAIERLRALGYVDAGD